MSEQQNSNSGSGGFGCLGWLVLGLVLGVIAMGGFGAVLDEAALRSRIEIYPHIPIDASTLGVQSSVVVLPTPAPTAIIYERSWSTKRRKLSRWWCPSWCNSQRARCRKGGGLV